MAKVRMNVYLPADLSEKLDTYCKRFDMPKNQLLIMATRAGLDALIRAIAPEDALTTARWAEIINEAERLKNEGQKAQSNAPGRE